jgi:hypothetical protein
VVVATVIVLAGAAVVAVPAAIAQLTSGVESATGQRQPLSYDPNVVMPWYGGLDDLPTLLDERVAMVWSGSLGSNPDWRGDDLVVTVSGRVFSLPGSNGWTPTVSPDGYVLVWYSFADQSIISRDTRNGSTYRYSPIASQDTGGATDRPTVQDGYPSAWSPDGSRLAILADVRSDESAATVAVVIDITDGSERRVDLTSGDPSAYVPSIGWSDDDTLLVPLAGGAESSQVTLASIGLDGAIEDRTPAGTPPDSGARFVLSPDGASLVTTSGALDPSVRRFDIESGSHTDFLCEKCDGFFGTQWASDHEIVVSPRTASDLEPVVSEAIDIRLGTTRAVAALAPRESPRQVVFARDVLAAGPAHTPQTSMWWPGWYLEWITYVTAGLILLGLVGAVVIRTIRRRRPTSSQALVALPGGPRGRPHLHPPGS